MKTLLLIGISAVLSAQMTPKQIEEVAGRDAHHGCGHHCEGGGGDGVPEPSTYLLMGGGLLTLAVWKKRKK